MHLPLRLIPLKYLVLIGFLISLLPLGLFVWQNTAIQKNVSLSWQSLTDNSIKSVRIAVELNALLVEIERSTKQRLILQSEPIAILANENINRYHNQVNAFISVAPETLLALCVEQNVLLESLKKDLLNLPEEALNDLLKSLRANQQDLMVQLWKGIDISKEQQIEIGLTKQKQVMLGLLGVSFLTFLLLLSLSSQIATPVNILKKKIDQLDEKQNIATTSTDFNAPKELLEINIQLDRLALRLVKLEMLRQSFLRHASHEFKTPLASIMESCAILKEEISGPLTNMQTEVVGILEDSTQNLKHLTEQLLDYNYLLQNADPNIEKHNVKILIDESVKRYQHFFLKRKQDVQVDCAVTLLETDSKLFTRIIDNLLSNAQAYGFENGKVLVKLHEGSSNSILTVANTGPRVPENQKHQILEPFAKSEVPRQDSLLGTGLGLSIVRDCVHLLNGAITIIDLPDFDFAIEIIFPHHN
ncbi:sensor histidine kinase [Psychromonas sp. KJ10-10]|uniref:sensor histidine kinase n=1 Tax=Psychromonas sp. KJ10-10 TaxID=3391823 RepID=UPI0039B6E8D5